MRPHRGAGYRYVLLEALGQDIAYEVLEAYPRIMGVDITIKKPHVAVGGVVSWLGISLSRMRDSSCYA